MILKPCLLDTSLVSVVLRKDSRSVFYAPHLDGFTQTLSFQTVAEMREGAMLANWGEGRRQALEEFLRRFVIVPFSDNNPPTRCRRVSRDSTGCLPC